ncbi:MAG: DUF3305 domain-containing protein [Kiloniellaceae bacterium]
MEKNETMPLGVVIERRRIDHPWKDHSWRPVAVIPGAPALDPHGPWTLLREGDGWIQFHAGTLTLNLFRSETESYRVNLAQESPCVFVVLRNNDDRAIDHELIPYLVTADPFEAQHYLDSGEETVEVIAMPPEVLALVSDFIAAHHVEEVFVKRRRKGSKGKDEPFSRRPPVDRPPRARARVKGGSVAGGES